MTPKSVLLADDDQTTLTVLTATLEDYGYRVDGTDRGEKCLFKAMEKDYDAFLIDLSMPGLGGVELCKKLRALAQYKLTPIIVITSMDEEANLGEVLSVGASDFISKPVNPVVLNARLKSHLEKKGYYDELERIRRYLNRYISSRTQRMVEAYATTGLVPEPELHHVCVMFTDIRGFTRLSARIELQELFARISYSLGQQVDMVYKYHGYIDKFGGDGLMAIFDGDRAVLNACECARQIIEQAIKHPEPLPIGIGLHYGPVLIGNIGSNEHLDYSALGETVNLSSRICNYADAMQIRVSQAVIDQLGDDKTVRYADVEYAKLRGYEQEVPIYRFEFD